MLGITPLGKIHDPNNEEMTLLDPSHNFWDEYEEPVTTKNATTEKIESAVRSLKEDDIFRMTYPYGEEADIIYCEVDEISNSDISMKTSCEKCETVIETQPILSRKGRHYHLKFSLDCPECEFSTTVAEHLQRR
jgi:hypothetical protein